MSETNIYFTLKLDEDMMRRVGEYDPDVCYQIMDDTFKSKGCQFEIFEDGSRRYTRNIDKNDFAYILMCAKAVLETMWFEFYGTVANLYIHDLDDIDRIMDEDEDWLEDGIAIRRHYRARISGIRQAILNDYYEHGQNISEAILGRLRDTNAIIGQRNGNITVNITNKPYSDLDLRVLYVDLKYENLGLICMLIMLIEDKLMPTNVVTLFGGLDDAKEASLTDLIKHIKQQKKNFRAIVLDYTENGWDEGCTAMYENCYLGHNMYRNLLQYKSFEGEWQIIPSEDYEFLKKLFYGRRLNKGTAKERASKYFKEAGIRSFSYCLPTKDKMISIYRLSVYTQDLLKVLNSKI